MEDRIEDNRYGQGEDPAGHAGIKPSFKPRTPYIFHFDDQSVALGDPEFLAQIDTNLTAANLTTRTTYWDQAFATGDEELFEPDPDPENINSVGIQGDEETFWNAMEAAVFQQTEWPEAADATVYFPEFPDWLKNAQSWFYDPVCPPIGPGHAGGWVRRRSVSGGGFPIGLFQLTDADSFWVFGTEDDLRGVMDLCSSLSRFRRGFDAITTYVDTDDTLGSIALPLICRETLHEELMIRGVDAETLFWE